jgi:hypothetical protein
VSPRRLDGVAAPRAIAQPLEDPAPLHGFAQRDGGLRRLDRGQQRRLSTPFDLEPLPVNPSSVPEQLTGGDAERFGGPQAGHGLVQRLACEPDPRLGVEPRRVGPHQPVAGRVFLAPPQVEYRRRAEAERPHGHNAARPVTASAKSTSWSGG